MDTVPGRELDLVLEVRLTSWSKRKGHFTNVVLQFPKNSIRSNNSLLLIS